MEGPALCRPKSVRDRCTINLYIGIPLLIIVAILQSSLLPRVPVFGLVPNLMLLTIVAWSFQRGPNEGLVWGLIGGLAIDLASGALVGISPLPLMVAALVAGIGSARIFSGNVVLPALVALLAIVLYQAIWLIVLGLVGQPVSWQMAIQIAPPLTLLNLALMPIVYFGISWLARLTPSSRVKLG